MKTKEELNALKEEVEVLNRKLAELSEEELKQVSGGNVTGSAPDPVMEVVHFIAESIVTATIDSGGCGINDPCNSDGCCGGQSDRNEGGGIYS